MSPNQPFEERLVALEKEVADLKRRLTPNDGQRNWLDEVSGSMLRFPEFEEVVQLGREFRESQSDPRN